MDGGDLNRQAFEVSPARVAAPAPTAAAVRPVAGGVRGATRRASTPGGLVLAGLAGFVAGAVCWHFVGFWSFMTEAVFYARPDGSQKIAQRPQAAKNQNRQPGAVVVNDANAACSLAVKDRAGDVQPRSCEGHAFKFHPTRNIVRADRGDFGPAPVPTLISGPAGGMVAVGGWSARIEGPDATSVVAAPKKPD